MCADVFFFLFFFFFFPWPTTAMDTVKDRFWHTGKWLVFSIGMENWGFLFWHNPKATGTSFGKMKLLRTWLLFLHVLNTQLREDNILVLWRGFKIGAEGLCKRAVPWTMPAMTGWKTQNWWRFLAIKKSFSGWEDLPSLIMGYFTMNCHRSTCCCTELQPLCGSRAKLCFKQHRKSQTLGQTQVAVLIQCYAVDSLQITTFSSRSARPFLYEQDGLIDGS